MNPANKSYQAFKKAKFPTLKTTSYFNVYDYLLTPYRGKNVTFIEIGVAGGGGLFMWRNFLGDRARIIGIDLNPEAKKFEKYGFEIYIGDQADKNFWIKFLKKIKSIDIILDDGGHTYEQQIISLESLIESVNDGGLYITEDTHTSYQSGFGSRTFSFMSYVKKLIDDINFRYYSLKEKHASEHRIYSIQIFESIVAFYIDRRESVSPSKPITNKFNVQIPQDFRYADNYSLWAAIKIINKCKSLKFAKSSLSKWMAKALINFISRYLVKTNKVREFFK